MQLADYEKNTTIIIPSRNVDFLLKECIEKIRELYKNIPVILVLDEINENFFNDENIKIMLSENRNMSAKRNFGVKNCNTEYIAFIDSDAYPNPNWLENGIKFLENNKEYSAVTGNQFIPETDSLEQKCLRLVRFSSLFTHGEWSIVVDKYAKETDVHEFMTANVIMRKADYINTGGMNENIYLAEDNEFSNRLAEKEYKIRFVPQVSVFHHEAKMYPFMRKIYSMGYYYANMFIKGKNIKNAEQTFVQFFPLIGVIAFLTVFCTGLFVFKSLETLYLLFLPLTIFLILTKEAYTESKKLNKNRIKGVFIILFSFCMFCLTYTFACFWGLLNLPSKSVCNLYKHY